MPGKIWDNIGGSRLGRQVLTAGGLLTLAAVLLFSVISTFQEVSRNLPDSPSPDTEVVQPVINEKVAQLPEFVMSGNDRQETALSSSNPDMSGKAEANSNREAIQALWQGTKTQAFGWQLHPVYGDWRYHNGVDISGVEGQVVPALADGEVVDVYTDQLYGLTVAVSSGKYTVYYSSLGSVAVQKNAMIAAGNPIGSMGSCASESEPHLHLSVKINDEQKTVDPQELFPDIPN